MHGLFFVELYKYLNTKLGDDMWNSALKESGIGQKIYVASAEYSDSEIIDLVSAASKLTGISLPSMLEDFGEFLALEIARIYGSFINPEWKTLDLLENTSELVHGVFRSRNPETKPPDLKSSRPSPDEVILTYNSSREMCSLAKGIVKGFARHFDEEVAVTETRCMLRGDINCEISVRLVTQHSFA